MGFCQWLRYFNDRFKFTHVAEIKLSVLIQIPITKMKFIRLLTINDTMASGMNMWSPPTFGQMLSSMEKKTSKIKSCTKKSTLLVKKSR